MKDKILFWIDAGLAHFGIAKFLQEKYDCELFAIYDLNNHLKKSFINQKIVNFQKVWYFWDYVSKTIGNLDLEYLKSFEKKYKIDLWALAYTERLFYKFNPYYKFKRKEILSILEQECKFFESVLDEIKPDFLVIKLTDFHRNHLLSEMCKAKGVRILMLIPTRFGYRATLSADPNKIEDFGNNIESENDNMTIIELQKYMKRFDKFQQTKKIKSGGADLSILKKIKSTLHWMIETFDDEYRSSYDHYGVTRLRTVIKETSIRIKARYRKFFIDRNFIREINDDEKFLYFPLQVDPERSISLVAPFYSNQLEVIVNIAKALPVNYKLYVKEHYNMRLRHWRNISYYKAILELPNVKLIHPSVKPEEVLSKCSLVITITGTSGSEAAFYQKPSIVFADVTYDLPSIHRLKSFEELTQSIRTSLQKEVNPSDLNKFVNLSDKNSFNFDVFGLHNDIIHRFHNDGFVINNDIKMQELELFLEENRGTFEQLAFEHIKKINHYKRYKSKE